MSHIRVGRWTAVAVVGMAMLAVAALLAFGVAAALAVSGTCCLAAAWDGTS